MAPEFTLAVHEILADRSGICKRIYSDVDRTYAMIAYLISSECRSGIWDHGLMRSRESKLIFGDRPIHPGALTSIGVAIHYNDPALVQYGVEILDSLNEQSLFEYFAPEDMERQGVYKFSAAYADEYRSSILASFKCLRDLYRESSKAKDEALIVVIG